MSRVKWTPAVGRAQQVLRRKMIHGDPMVNEFAATVVGALRDLDCIKLLEALDAIAEHGDRADVYQALTWEINRRHPGLWEPLE